MPQVYQAVQIGDFYWDGGYTENPALAPLYLGTSDLRKQIGCRPFVYAMCHGKALPDDTALAKVKSLREQRIADI